MQLVIKINLVNYANEDDGMELGENIVAPLLDYDPEENGATDTRACIQDVSYYIDE